jgi:transposase InsO family protein
VRRIGRVDLIISCGEHQLIHKFEVLESEDPMLIGIDIFAKLGFYVGNVPTQYPGPRTGKKARQRAARAEALLRTRSKPWSLEHAHAQPDLEIIDAVIRSQLRTNAALDQSQPACPSIPESTLHLPMALDDDPAAARQARTFVRQYPLNKAALSAVDAQIQKWFDMYCIEPADSRVEFNSPMMAASKKDGEGGKTSWRTCFDLRHINVLLSAFGKPPSSNARVPRIEELLERAQGFDYASCLDLSSAYQQMMIAPEDRYKLAFTWNNRKYQWRRWPFGLCHATAQFQKIMEKVLEGIDGVLIYVDDVAILSNGSAEEHAERVSEVLKRMNEHSLRLNQDKCHFGFKRIVMLGHQLSGDEQSVDPDKVKQTIEWPTPKTAKEIMRFLGFTNFVRSYIPNYAQLAHELEALRSAKGKFELNEAQKLSFENLKAAISEGTVLSSPRDDLPFFVSCDASQFGMGAVLYQEEKREDGSTERRFIAFASKSLNGAQQNYPATKRELLGVVFALRSFSHWILGERFILYTDHMALTTMFTTRHQSYVIANWLDVLLEYDFEVRHRPGIQMILPDALSRLFQPPTAPESEAFAAQLADEAAIEGIRVRAFSVQDKVRAPNLAMKEFVKERMNKETITNTEEQLDFVRSFHTSGHFGASSLFDKVWEEGYFWDGLRKQCDEVVATCHNCLQYSVKRHGFHPIRSLRADSPWDHVAVDCAVELPTSDRGNRHILIVVDVATRYAVTRPLPDLKEHTVARALFEIFTVFGPPKALQSDNGTEFVNKVLKDLLQSAGVDKRMVAGYNPQANGLAERFVRTLKTVLKKKLEGNMSRWDDALPGATLAINTKDHELLKTAPFTLFFARGANAWTDYEVQRLGLTRDPEATRDALELRPEEVQRLVDQNKAFNEQVRAPVREAAHERQDRRNEGTDARRNTIQPGSKEIKPGTLVYIIDQSEDSKSKWAPNHVGPFLVKRQSKRNLTFWLDNLSGKTLPTCFPIHHLLFVEDTTLPVFTQDGKPLVKGKKDEVQMISDDRTTDDGDTEYLISWRDNKKKNEWVKASFFAQGAATLINYHRKEGPLKLSRRLQPRRAAKKTAAKRAAPADNKDSRGRKKAKRGSRKV